MGLLGINIDYVKAGGNGFLRETKSADGGSGTQQTWSQSLIDVTLGHLLSMFLRTIFSSLVHRVRAMMKSQWGNVSRALGKSLAPNILVKTQQRVSVRRYVLSQNQSEELTVVSS